MYSEFYYRPPIHEVHSLTSTLSVVADVVTILGILGLVLAYIEYRGRVKDEERQKIRETLHAITAIKSQLVTIGYWTGYGMGGYKTENQGKWIQDQYLERANPFHKIFALDYSYLKNVTALPGVQTFDVATNQALAWVVQWCSSFNSFLDEIQEFKYSRPTDKNIALQQKFSIAKSRCELYDSLDDDEKIFTDTLLNMYIRLHFTIISDERNRALHFWHKRLLDALNRLETTKNQELNEI